jgi:chromosome segregation ATPase
MLTYAGSMARQQAEGEATAKISAQQTILAAENRCLAQQLAEAERRVERSQDRVRALKMEVDASKLVTEDLRRKILDAQHQHCGVPSLVPNLSSAQKTQESKKAEFKASGAMQAMISPTLQTLRKQISEAMSVLCDIMTKALVDKARMEEREDFLANAFAQLHQKEQEMEERETFVCKELEMARKVADLDIENARNECNIMRKEFVDATAKLTSALSLIETLKEGQPPAQRTSRHLQPLERQLEETIEEAVALKRSNDKLQARIAFMDNTISAGEECSRFLAEKLKHVEASRELERESREACEKEIATLKRGLEDLKGAKNDLDLERCLENSKHTEQIAELENERDNQFTEIAHLKQSVDDLNRAFLESEERCNLEIEKLIRLEALIKNIQTHIEACALRTQVASLDVAIKKADAVKSINHEELAEMARLEIELVTQV